MIKKIWNTLFPQMKPKETTHNNMGQITPIEAERSDKIKKELGINPDDYGYGFEAREMIDGGWVLWNTHRNKACDLKTFGCFWTPGESYFRDCIGSREEIHSNAKKIMASFGVFKLK